MCVVKNVIMRCIVVSPTTTLSHLRPLYVRCRKYETITLLFVASSMQNYNSARFNYQIVNFITICFEECFTLSQLHFCVRVYVLLEWLGCILEIDVIIYKLVSVVAYIFYAGMKILSDTISCHHPCVHVIIL